MRIFLVFISISATTSYELIRLESQNFIFEGNSIEKVELINKNNICTKDAPIFFKKISSDQTLIGFIGDEKITK